MNNVLDNQVSLDQLLAPWPETEQTKHFREFHAKNPQVYRGLVRLAGIVRKTGREKVAIELLVNQLRWEHYLTTSDPNSDFKINSNYKPYYARLLMEQEPELRGLFDTRTMWKNGDFEVAA